MNDILYSCMGMSLTEFQAKVLGQEPLHTPATDLPDGAESPITEDDVHQALHWSGLRTQSVGIVRDNEYVPEARYGRGTPSDVPGTAPYIDPDRVQDLVRQGYSLVLRAMHRYSRPAASFARRLSRRLGHPVAMHAFVTPSGARAVAAHFDPADVFVFQVSGEKHWTIKPSTIAKPIPSQAWTSLTARQRAECLDLPAEPRKVRLRTGDVLYLPRGYLHSAEATDSPSIHVTAAITPITTVDVLLAVLEASATEHEWLRDAVDLATFGAVDVREALARLVDVTTSEPATAEALWALRQRAWADLPPEPVPLALTPDAALSPDAATTPDSATPCLGPDRYRLREGILFSLAPHDNGSRLRTGDAELDLPPWCMPLLDQVLTGEDFTVTELADRVRNSSIGQAEELVRVLSSCAVIVPARGQGDGGR